MIRRQGARMNVKMLQAAEKYLEQRENIVKSTPGSTLSAETYAVNAFVAWMRSSLGYHTLTVNLDSNHIAGYLNHIVTTKGNKPQSLNNTRRNLQAFVRWLHEEGLLAKGENPERMFRSWKRKKPDVTPKRLYDQSEILQIVDHADLPRDRMLVWLFICTLARAVSIKDLKWGDVDWNGKKLRINDIKVGDRGHYVPFTLQLEEELIRWRNHYEAAKGSFYDELEGRWITRPCGPVQDSWFLVPGMPGGMMFNGKDENYRSVYVPNTNLKPECPMTRPHHYVQKAMIKAGLPSDGEGGHTFRRSMARLHFDRIRAVPDDEGMMHSVDSAALVVMAWTNHTQLDTFLHYIQVAREKTTRDRIWAGKDVFDPLTKPAARPAEGSNVVDLMSRRKKA